MIQTTTDGAIVITIRVIPRASKAGIAGTRGDAVLVRLGAAPVDGAANDELIDVLAKALDVPRRAIAIVSGDRARLKRVRVTGIDAATATTRLMGAPGPPAG